MSPEEELAARERKRSVKFKDKEVVKRISESENPEFNGSTLEGDQEAPVSDADNVTRKGEEDERKNITNGNGNFEKEEAISMNNGALRCEWSLDIFVINLSAQICYRVGESILTLHSVIFRFIIFEY